MVKRLIAALATNGNIGLSGDETVRIDFPSRKAKFETSAARLSTGAVNDLKVSVRKVVSEVIGANNTLVRDLDPTLVPVLDAIAEALKNARNRISEKNIGTLVELMLPSNDPAAAVLATIDAENAAARIRFMENVPCLTSAQLAEQLGHGAKNKSQTASRWKAEQRAFSVPWRGREAYPAFQFRDGRPLPVVAKVLGALPEGMTPWQIAFWFVSSNPWLDGKAPYTMLADTDAVVKAAKQEDEVIFG
ncbi:MAG: hypothetical protein AB7U61_00690 [Methylocystis sp.]